MLKCLYKDLAFKEVPDEVSLVYGVTGCPLKCKGCHSPELRDKAKGVDLPTFGKKSILEDIEKYKEFITCVCFMGGDWDIECLRYALQTIKRRFPDMKTCLYSGYPTVDDSLLDNLDYVKVGPYVEKLGGLESSTTNQRFFDLKKNEDITWKFYKKAS